jgi:hypothetical protein
MERKYTKDGRKVAVIGKLNAEEWIVQEIFVREGQEVPGGENFTAKGLLDAPAESWKEKNLRELEARYEADSKAWQARIDKTNRTLSMAHEKAALKIKALVDFDKNALPEHLQTLLDFIAGRITHVFVVRYGVPRIAPIDDELFQIDNDYGRSTVEGLRLLTLYGSTGGVMAWRLNQYRDGSGSSNTEVELCRSYAHALALAQALFDATAKEWLAKSGKQCVSWLECWEKMEGLKIPDAVRQRFREIAEEQKAEQIEKLRRELAALEGQG